MGCPMPKTPPERSYDVARLLKWLLWLLLLIMAGLDLYHNHPDLWLLWLAL